jgi:hypothetical protein
MQKIRYLTLILVTACGQINVKGGTTNKVEGTTRHEIVLSIDPKMCEGQENVPECIERLTAMLEKFLETLDKTKELNNEPAN